MAHVALSQPPILTPRWHSCAPSGRISETEVVVQFLALLAAGLGTAYGLDQWAGHETPTLFYLAVFGSFISYIYSAPPLKLKQSGWAGNYALGASYIALPWWAGQVGRAAAMLLPCCCHAAAEVLFVQETSCDNCSMHGSAD
jgi:4-hydroxybenzoate polyprenyltransferase